MADSPEQILSKQLKQIEDVQAFYKEGAEAKGFNALVYGPTGSGKTSLIATARRPVYAYMLDPKGEVTVRDEIDEGWLVADTRFQADDIREPHSYKDWEKDYREKKNSGFFDLFATVAIDSITTWGVMAMNRVLKDMGRTPGKMVEYEKHKIESYGLPFQQDYGPQMSIIEHMVRDILTLPCDVIFTAHPDEVKNDEGRTLSIAPMVTGRLKARLPLLFTEIYVTMSQTSAGGITYKLLTRNNGLWTARTRIGKKGIFDTFETPNIKYLLKKGGYSADDKPMPWLDKTG
jgi:hypothetical protein